MIRGDIESFVELADNAPVMVWRAGVNSLCDWFNAPWLAFTGRTMEQETGLGWAEGVHPDDLATCLETYEHAFAARKTFSMIYRLRRHDGEYRWLLDNGGPFQRHGEFAGYFGSCIDITDQRLAQMAAEKALAERDAVLREVFHRVKNMLQQIEGLIALETRGLGANERAAMARLSGRVRAMGAVHDTLMRSNTYAGVSAPAFISSLVAKLDPLGGNGEGASIRANVDDMAIEIERAAAIGLLVHELIAWTRGDGGVEISFRQLEEGGAVLEIAPEHLPVAALSAEPSRKTLVEGLVRQLRSEMTGPDANGRIVVELSPLTADSVS